MTGIPANMFAGNTHVRSLQNCFSGCSSLLSIGANFMPDMIVTEPAAANMFSNAGDPTTGMTLSSGMFALQTNIINFSAVFNGAKIAVLPADTFPASINSGKTRVFDTAFMNSKIFSGIPAGLFATQTGTVSFYRCFSACDNTATGSLGDVFNGNALPNITRVDEMFNNCVCQNAPVNFFRNLPNCRNFSLVFNNSDIRGSLPDIPAPGTGSYNFNQAFRNNNYATYIQPLWTRNYPVSTSALCFQNCSSASNWGDVPAQWR
jgi:hypothetical protein